MLTAEAFSCLFLLLLLNCFLFSDVNSSRIEARAFYESLNIQIMYTLFVESYWVLHKKQGLEKSSSLKSQIIIFYFLCLFQNKTFSVRNSTLVFWLLRVLIATTPLALHPTYALSSTSINISTSISTNTLTSTPTSTPSHPSPMPSCQPQHQPWCVPLPEMWG